MMRITTSLRSTVSGKRFNNLSFLAHHKGVVYRVAIIGIIFFIAIINKIFKVIAILSVIGDNFGKARNTIAETIFILFCVSVSRNTFILYPT